MDEQGHGTPKGFNPPIHWNELYDHPFWWATKATGRHYDTVEDRQRLYTFSSLEEEAKKPMNWDVNLCTWILDGT